MIRTLLMVVAILATPFLASAQASIPVQGVLTDVDGEPIHDSLSMTFRLYSGDGELEQLWVETQTVNFDEGFFTAQLGEQVPLSPELFAENSSLLLGITIAGDDEMTPFEIGMAPYAAFAEYAGDAQTLDGRTAEELMTGAGITPNWSDIADVPPALMDGDADTLASLGCIEGAVAQFVEGVWTCGSASGAFSVASPLTNTSGVVAISSGGITADHVANYSLTDADIAPSAAIDATKIEGTAATLIGSQYFDGDTLAIDAVNNRVGIGTPTPSQSLDVTGSITTSGDFRYRTTRTSYLSAPATVFVPTEDTTDDFMTRSTSGYAYMSSGTSTYSAYMFASVDLPTGAELTELRCYAYDNHSTEDLTGYVRLYRRGFTETSSTTLATATFTTSAVTSSTMQESYDDTVANNVVDASLYSYYLYLYFYSGTYVGSSMRFYGCRIAYEHDIAL